MCFSRDHHTILCPDRYTVPNIFVPAINRDLHSRFFRLFEGILEQHQLAFLSQEMFDTINAWPNPSIYHGYRENGLRVTYRELQFFDSLTNRNHT
uniref:Uncharacterized protein n=1 Tax=Panagrolaimus sp. PS1159 TaxID=55785 RepID=A0AC35G2X0_9BILA